MTERAGGISAIELAIVLLILAAAALSGPAPAF